MNKDFLFNIIKILLKPLAAVYFWIVRWIMNNKLRYELNDNNFGKPNLLSYPFIIFVKLFRRIYNMFFLEFNNYALSKYKIFSKQHYSSDGPAYGGLRNLNSEEKKNYYINSKSRLEYFYNNNKYLLDFKNGDSFLDIACGYGRDIKFLSNKFDKSKIDGFDINASALEVIKAGDQNVNINLKEKSFLDFNFLNEIRSKSYDWVLISHVLSVVVGANLEETLYLRRKLVSEFVRISNKGLLILDNSYTNNLKLTLEQNTRCVIYQDFTEFFSSLKDGELYMMKSKDSFAYLWKKIIN